MTVRIATIDNHEIVRDGITGRVAASGTGIETVASTATVDEFLASGVEADVVLLDLMLDSGPSDDRIPDLMAHGARVLLFTTEERPVPLRRAVARGASGVLLKSDPPATIITAVHEAAAGGFCCSGPVAHALLTDATAVADLSPRQVEILRALNDGLDYRQTASLLGVKEAVVKTHLQRVREKFRKIGIEPGNSHHLARLVARQGDID